APNSMTLHVALAEAFWEMGHAREAVDVARRATQIEPRNKLGWRTLGIALVRAGQAAEAQRQLAELVRIAPDDPAAHHQLGDAAALAGDFPAAAASLRRAVELKPDYADAWSRLGGVLRNLDDPDAAVDVFTRAAAIDPNPDTLSNLGDALIACARADEAAAALERALATDPAHLVAQVNLGCARMR